MRKTVYKPFYPNYQNNIDFEMMKHQKSIIKKRLYTNSKQKPYSQIMQQIQKFENGARSKRCENFPKTTESNTKRNVR